MDEWCSRMQDVEGEHPCNGMENEQICQVWAEELYHYLETRGKVVVEFEEFFERFIHILYDFAKKINGSRKE